MKKKYNIINIIIILIATVAMTFGGLFYFKLKRLEVENISLNKKDKEINSIVSKISSIYLFPEGEIPTIAIVSDPALLKGQSFSNLSQKGDNVLIFSKIGKAVLYRPSINKIIDIASIKIN